MAFNHLFDVAFEVVSNYEDETQIPVEDLITALEHRVRVLKSYKKDEALEAFGHCDVYEVEDGI